MKVVQIEFSNSEVYAVPTDVIAQDRAEYYARKFAGEEGTYEEIYEKEMKVAEDDIEILDWINNNMNWQDVAEHATQISTEGIDKQEEFTNAEKTVTEINSE